MGADQVAAIRPALQELMDGFQRNETGASDLCATFSVPSHPDAWVQVAAGIINFSYPRSEEPLGLLRSADVPQLPGLTLQTFAPLAYVTLSHEPCPSGQLARFIDRVLSLVHELPPDDYPIDVEFESLA